MSGRQEVKTPSASSMHSKVKTIHTQSARNKIRKTPISIPSKRQNRLKSVLANLKSPTDASGPKPSISVAEAQAKAKEAGRPPATSFNAFLSKSIRDPSNYYFRHPECVEGVLGKQTDVMINRQHKLKNSFLSVFPSYGLQKPGSEFKTSKQEMDSKVKEAIPGSREHFRKWDDFKAYQEQMLKSKNMGSLKK